jgi:hypothetical protein
VKRASILRVRAEVTFEELTRLVAFAKQHELPITHVSLVYSGTPLNPFIELVAREFGRQLRDFSYVDVDDYRNDSEFRINDECIEILVKYCPLIETLILHNCYFLTRKSMQLMHRRWMGTLRYLDVSPGTRDPMYSRDANDFGLNKNHADDEHSYFFFDECFSD